MHPESTQADCGRAKSCGHLIGAIDQGTSSTRFLVFESGSGRLMASSQLEIKRIVPKEGWVEIEPDAIMESVNSTIARVSEQLSGGGGSQPMGLKCVGICNQRESTVVWDSATGRALYNVIVWMDNRTKDLVDQMIDLVPGRDFNFLKDKTGLPMSTYFSAFKLKWLIDNVEPVKVALRENRLRFGTVDSWILWNLTGNHLTDVTNASRTFLMDIETLEWDKSLCKQFGIPMNILPKILSSADNFGQILHGPLRGLPITGVIGDQSAALFGHNCLQLGQTKATFGTGCFIMQNIGPGPLNGAMSGVQRQAKRGLITTVAYKLADRPACYALEGSIKIAGAALTWLRDNMQLIRDYDECDQLVNKTSHSAGVFFVPALGGLYSPYWDPNAAGLYIGLSQFSRREHLVRATFDSIAFQTNDILSLMRGVTNGLMIDGGLCKSDNVCQILADITGCDIVRPSMCETSALGAAMVAGCGASIWPYEELLANSNTPYEYSSSSNQNHHYPHETLHYDDKFSSLIQPKEFTASDLHAKFCRAIASTAPIATHLTSSNLDAGGGVNDDAGGGGGADGGRLSRQSDVDEFNGGRATGGASSQMASSRSTTSVTSLVGDTCCATLGGNPLPAIQLARGEFYATPSSGYSSADNSDLTARSSDAMRRDSPTLSSQPTEISSTLLCSGSGGAAAAAAAAAAEQTQDPFGPSNVNQQCTNQESQNQDSASTFISQTLPSSISKCLRDYICTQSKCGADLRQANGDQNFETNDIGEVDDLYDEDYDSATSSDEQDLIGELGRAAPIGQSRRLLTKPVDVFQSYISLEHRTELVNTWRLAVERSMQWTKVQHEELRRIDYQRLSSLPISMYLFFSIGMVALSGILSAGRGALR